MRQPTRRKACVPCRKHTQNRSKHIISQKKHLRKTKAFPRNRLIVHPAKVFGTLSLKRTSSQANTGNKRFINGLTIPPINKKAQRKFVALLEKSFYPLIELGPLVPLQLRPVVRLEALLEGLFGALQKQLGERELKGQQQRARSAWRAVKGRQQEASRE